MTPKYFCCFIMLIASLTSQAQDRRTIQISETDTVILNPTSIEYVVSTNTTPNLMEAISQNKKGLSGGSDVTPANMETVMTLLRNHHLSWEKSRAKGYAIGRNNIMGDSPITITVHSETELRSLYMLLAPLSGITASIGEIEYEPRPDRLSIYKTLYQRALTEATGMAAVSGKTLGDLVSVEEPQDPLWSMRQMMEGMMPAANLIAQLSGNARTRLQKKEETKLLFKFELK